MKNIILCVFITLAQTALFAQTNEAINDEFNYRVTYKLSYQLDSNNVDSKKSEAMVLYLGDKISRFSSLGKVMKDSLKNSNDMANFNPASFQEMMAQMPKTDFEYYIYKERPTEELSYTEDIVVDSFRYIEDEQLEWEILPEMDSLHGYHVQKATTKFSGRNYTAWFTNEIPIPDGPYKFRGLPGLILKISDTKNHYVFEVSEFKRLQEPLSFTFSEKDYIHITKDKFVKAKSEFKRDRIAYINSLPEMTISVSYDSPADKNRIESQHREQLKKENNPIELK